MSLVPLARSSPPGGCRAVLVPPAASVPRPVSPCLDSGDLVDKPVELYEEVADAGAGAPVLVPVQRAYPRAHLVRARGASLTISTLADGYTKAERERFVASALVSDRVRVMLNEPYGKDTLSQCFVAEAAFRHCLLPLWKSGCLESPDWVSLRSAIPFVDDFSCLWDELAHVDFNPLRGFQSDWESVSTLCPLRVQMVSAALFHFNGDAAALVRWMGGSHVHAHRDIPALMAFLEGKLDPVLFKDVCRIYTSGIPRRCRAVSTEANFQAFFRYGNHASASAAPDKAYQALVKDARRGFVIPFDRRVIPFVLHCHVTPQGMVDMDNPYKKPRPIFDSTFRPDDWCMAINDWTSMAQENPVLCVDIEKEFMQWIWNLRITYPSEELYLADDDVSGAFRWLKYHPNLVAMHTSVQSGFGVLNTGGTFGGTTTPPNWDLLARARRAIAEWLWVHDPSVVATAAPFMPPLQFSAVPSPAEVAAFTPAFADTLNPGVLAADGQRLPPPFLHHVDDCAKCDVGSLMPRAVSASTVSLYHLVGFPAPEIPNPLSLEKLETFHSWERAIVGRLWNTRRMTVGMLPRKRVELLARFEVWASMTSFSLREIGELLGVLDNHVRYVPWARPWLFAIQNQMRTLLRKLWGVQHRLWFRTHRDNVRSAALKVALPQSIWNRINGILAREKAQFLWNLRIRLHFDPHIRYALSQLRHYVLSTESPWEATIGTVIPRDPQVEAWGDASEFGGGGYCPGLRFWFDVLWSPRVCQAILLPSDAPDFVHINMLEFVVVILLLAATIVAFETLTPAEILAWFPAGLPAIPVLRERCDNTTAVAWSNKVTSSSPQGQKLLGIYAELLRTHSICLSGDHIAGKANDLADFISRPSNPALFHAARAAQLFQMHPSMRFWRIFLPSPELLQLLTCALFSPLPAVPPRLPPRLGRLVLAASTSSCSPTI
jgi:hypothetical protein